MEEEKEKILMRQKKWGVITEIPEVEEEKKKKRLERFGFPIAQDVRIYSIISLLSIIVSSKLNSITKFLLN